jgi:hypothetical protein
MLEGVDFFEKLCLEGTDGLSLQKFAQWSTSEAQGHQTGVTPSLKFYR